MGIVLALLSALSYGISDVIGGLAARRISFMRVALIGQAGGLCATAVMMMLFAPAPARTLDLAWGAASGIGTGFAMVSLFRGMSRGSMSVVVPISAVGGIALPVLFSFAFLNERPPWFTWVGIAVAIPALWLIGRGTETHGSTSANRSSVVDGLAAGSGIAIQYLCLAQAGAGSGLWPILTGRAAAVGTILVAAAIHRHRDMSRDSAALSPPVFGLSVGSGVLAAAALSAYLYALTTEFVTVTVVLSSLYPIVPTIVGLAFLKERLRRAQVYGLVAALAATLVIAVA